MINILRGKIIEQELDSITLDVNGVGYKIFVINGFLSKNATNKDETTVYTYLAVRENALDLYGFANLADKSLFKLLLTVSGIGPKSALNIMNSLTREMIEESVYKNDPNYLSKISGIGKKTAEKILIGLKDKIGTISAESAGKQNDNSLAIDAMVSLGYSERSARDIIKEIKKENKSTQEIIKEALTKINK